MSLNINNIKPNYPNYFEQKNAQNNNKNCSGSIFNNVGTNLNFDWFKEATSQNNKIVADANKPNIPTSDWFKEATSQNNKIVADANKPNIPTSDWFKDFSAENEKIIANTNKNPNVSFDPDGNMISNIYDNSGKLIQNSYYDKNGKIKEIKTYNEDGTIKETIKRTNNTDGSFKDTYSNKSGNHIKDSYYDSYGRKFQDSLYGNDGKMNSYKTYNTDGSLKNAAEIQYNYDGTVLEIIKNNAGKNVLDINYDKDNKINHYNTYDENGSLKNKTDRRYNDNGNMIDTVKDSSGKFIREEITDKNGKMTTRVELEKLNATSGAWGDPHFQLEGKQAFDFQGVSNTSYKMLENQDISLSAKFADWGTAGAKIIKDQNLEFKDEGINIITHANGKFEIYNNSVKIGDQSNFNSDAKITKVLSDNNISLKFQNNILTTIHENRTISQQLNGSYINDSDDTLMKGDVGLLAQAIGALDKDSDGKTTGVTDINKDGKVDSNDIINYNLLNQFMVASPSGVAAPITNQLKSMILADFADGLTKGSAIKGFNTNHGYTALQWNEIIGENIFTVKSNKFLA